MFRLILLLLLFLLFMVNYFFSYLQTMPYFKFIIKFNLYKQFIYNFENRKDIFTGIEYNKVIINGKEYITNYSGGYLTTRLKFSSKDGNNLTIYIPIFIVHTGANSIKSGDNIFTGLNKKIDFLGYIQYITGGYNYINIGEKITDRQTYAENIYLGYFYAYCSMTGTQRIDAYLFNRYKQWNISGVYKEEQQDPNYNYVCKNDNTEKVCPSGYSECSDDSCECYRMQGYNIYYTNKIYSCYCENKGEYFICKNENGFSCNTSECIDYLTGTIDLNTTNCNMSGALGYPPNNKYFLIR